MLSDTLDVEKIGIGVRVRRISVQSGIRNSMIFNLPIKVFEHGMSAWLKDGRYVQDAFPSLNATQREFLLTGMSEDEQNKFYD